MCYDGHLQVPQLSYSQKKALSSHTLASLYFLLE